MEAEIVSHSSMSAYALFMQADWVIKTVMVGLLLASVACWAIVFSKLAAFGSARRQARAFDRLFAAGEPLETLYDRLGPNARGLAALFVAGMDEWTQSCAQNAMSQAGLSARLHLALDGAIAEQSHALEHRLSFLATVGSAAPFIGLFGTVWGIMNAFTAIAGAESTNLAVVAPGIAEALFATALGLLAAIPAVIAYNKLMGDAGTLRARYESFADRFIALLSRRFDAERSAT